jgi:hypothetical protein
MLRILAYAQWWWHRIPGLVRSWRRSRGAPEAIRREDGQSTAEYALVMLAAAAIALVLLAWARSSGKLPAFFDRIIDRIVGSAE